MSGQKLRGGVSYGCHVDLKDEEEADGCVIDYGSHADCVHATFASGRKRTSVWTCRHWLPVKKGTGMGATDGQGQVSPGGCRGEIPHV